MSRRKTARQPEWEFDEEFFVVVQDFMLLRQRFNEALENGEMDSIAQQIVQIFQRDDYDEIHSVLVLLYNAMSLENARLIVRYIMEKQDIDRDLRELIVDNIKEATGYMLYNS